MCVFCRLLECESGICSRCEGSFPRNNNFCCRCGQPIDAPANSSTACGACITNAPAFDIARAPMRYDFPIDAALKMLKFNSRLLFAPPLASLLAPVVRETLANCDVLVPVPLYRWRHASRGFNQADELCRSLATETKLPVFSAVTRNRATRSQSGLDAAARVKNVRKAFVVDAPLRFRYPLIVDDVITTGATCNELAIALKRAGAARVAALAVARSSDL
jgi:ComF family protein